MSDTSMSKVLDMLVGEMDNLVNGEGDIKDRINRANSMANVAARCVDIGRLQHDTVKLHMKVRELDEGKMLDGLEAAREMKRLCD